MAFLLQIVTSITEQFRCGICLGTLQKPVVCIFTLGYCVIVTKMRHIVLKASPVNICSAALTSYRGTAPPMTE